MLRCCHILLASARGARAPRSAQQVVCGDQTVLDALHAVDARGLAVLENGCSRPHRPTPWPFPDARAEQGRALLHRNPCEFGRPTRLWTLKLAAGGAVPRA